MKLFLPLAAALAAVSLSCSAFAQDADVKKNDMIYSADGKRIGRVHDIDTRSDGTVVARIIYANKFVSIPVSTLTAGEKGFVSSLSREQIKGN